MKTLAVLPVMIVALVFSVFAFAAEEKQDTKLVRVENKKVCMVNDRLFEKDQIPVEVEGKTYFGCCKMCKKALAEQADLRMATDPVSGQKVDKASAVIGADSEGTTFYFENEANLNAFNKE